MREIKFRTFVIASKEMIYGRMALKVRTFTQSYRWYASEVEVMQSTGLKDKNGVEIYEGDIVRFTYGEGPSVSSDGNDVIDAWSEEEVSEVTFSQGAFLIGKHLMWALDRMGMDYSIEVIGNIYENPELLEDKR